MEIATTDCPVASAMKKPLILGASVSADYFTDSPGKRLALRYTKPENVKVVARNGTCGRDILRSMNETQLADRTSIICVDTFFWDSIASYPHDSLKAVEAMADFAMRNDIPLVIAEVPVFLASVQVSARKLNDKIAQLGERHKSCRVLPLNRILQETFERGFITRGGEQIPIERLMPDGLHIAEPASEFIADQIEILLRQTR